MAENKEILEKAYVIKFRKMTGAVKELHFGAINDVEAGKKARKFCAKHNFRFIYAKPFLTDLDTWESL